MILLLSSSQHGLLDPVQVEMAACPGCGKIFSSRNKLKYHIQRMGKYHLQVSMTNIFTYTRGDKFPIFWAGLLLLPPATVEFFPRIHWTIVKNLKFWWSINFCSVVPATTASRTMVSTRSTSRRSTVVRWERVAWSAETASPTSSSFSSTCKGNMTSSRGTMSCQGTL